MNHDKKELYTAKRTADIDLGDCVEIWNSKLRNNADPNSTTWMALTIDATKKVNVAGTGSGDISNLIASLSEDEIFYGGLRINTQGGQVKFIHFFIVGSNVSAMKKGKASLWKNAVLGSLEGAHGSVELNGLDDAADELDRQLTAICNTGWYSVPRCR